MPQPSPEDVKLHFAQLSVQYFVAGRSAAINQLIPVLGNLLHHAVELALKAALAPKLALQDLKRLNHNLPKLWERFKSLSPQIDCSRFDSVVDELHRFEELRYPDSVLAQGALMELILLREHLGSGPRSPSTVPRYTLVLEDVDEIVEFIFDVSDINPKFLTGAMTRPAKDYLLRENRHATKWQ